MPKKIGAIGSDDDRKDIDIALQMANNPNYQQKAEQKDKNVPAEEIKNIQAKQQQQVKTQQTNLAEEQQRLQDVQNISVKPATADNVRGSIYDRVLNSKPDITHDDGLRKINSSREAELIKARLITAKNDIPKIDGELAQKSSFAATDGTPVRDAIKVMDSVQAEIKKNDDIAQQYITQAETLVSQYSNTSMVHELIHDKQLSNQMKDSTHKTNPDANLDNKTEAKEKDLKEKELKEKELKEKFKVH